MKTSVKSLLDALDIVSIDGKLPKSVSGISQDSRRIKPGYIFAVRTGASVSGFRYAKSAEQAGAVIILTDEKIDSEINLPIITIKNFYKALCDASLLIYDNPSKRMKLIGITGTDGKTSTAHIIKSILNEANYECGMLGTIGYDTISNKYEARLTTPEIDEICELLDEIITSAHESEVVWAVMEVSSHALELGRVEGLSFTAVGITNLNPEHMDFHQTFDDYALAKSKLFSMLDENAPGVINISARKGDTMISACTGKVVTYGHFDSGADYSFNTIEHSLAGGRYLISKDSEHFEIESELIGEYQGENITLAAAVLLELGLEWQDVVSGVKALRNVPGRMERIRCGQPFSVMVDYAHTPQALETSLKTIKPLCRAKLTSLFGCGGDRDNAKRPEMAKVVAANADRIIVANDNPRTEDPLQIIDDILTGIQPESLSKVMIEPDRKLAIELAIKLSEKDDVVVISGKGAESYQQISEAMHPFDDREVARKALNQAGWSL